MFDNNIFPNMQNESNLKLAEEEFEKLYSAPVEVVVILSIFYGVISIIAIVGNTLVIWVVTTTRQMHTVTNMYIANLAFADVIIGMFCIPFQAALLQKWHLPEFMCAFCPFIQVVSVNVSVFTLTAIAVDRHRAIINPLRARPTRFISKMIIFGIWIAAFSFAIPCAIAFRVEQLTETFRDHDIIYNITRPFCENANLSDEQLQTYRYYLVFVQYVVPFCVISFVYIQMAVRLWGTRTPGNAQDARDITLLKNKKKVIKMLIIVVIVFGLCWLPLQTYNILYVTWSELNEYRFINIIWFCCDWLAMSNSCYNPFIYGIYNEKFKREFNKRFTFCVCKLNSNGGIDPNDKTISNHTRGSSIRSSQFTKIDSSRIRNNCQLIQNYPQIRTPTTNSTSTAPTSPLILKQTSINNNLNLKYNPFNIFNNKTKKLPSTSILCQNCNCNNQTCYCTSLVLENDMKIYDNNCKTLNGYQHHKNINLPSNIEFKSINNDNHNQRLSGNCKDIILSYNQTKYISQVGIINKTGSDEIGDGLRKHKGRIIDTNRNRIIMNSKKEFDRQKSIIDNEKQNHHNYSIENIGNDIELNEISSVEYPFLLRETTNSSIIATK